MGVGCLRPQEFGRKLKFTGWTLLYFLIAANAHAQLKNENFSFWHPAPDYNPARGRFVAAVSSGSWLGGMGLLYGLWYRDYPQSSFHFFNDGGEWLQMDKVGHCGSAYFTSLWASSMVNWTGATQRRSALVGSVMSLTFMTTIEVFDGFSSNWGFSKADMLSNLSGTALFLGQELLWKEQRVLFKYSYQRDNLAGLRPDVFGHGLAENILKDYNGQTYWLSVNLKSFANKTSLPSWLNLAAGYGAGGMLYAEDESGTDGYFNYSSYRQFYFSPDIDWRKIPVRSGVLKTVFSLLSFVKIPAPAIEYRSNGRLVLHGLYF